MSITGGSVETDIQNRELKWAEWLMGGAVGLTILGFLTALGLIGNYVVGKLR